MACVLIQKGVPALGLAPMEGVTDAPMREVLTGWGGFSYCVSEFLRVSQTAPPDHVFYRYIPELKNGAMTSSGVPVQVQLLGGDAELMAEAASTAVRLGSSAVDINFGCPAPTVNRHDGGATLLKYPERIRSIVAALRAALPAHVPVSAKLRLGWDDPRAIHLNADMAAEGGASWITIHGRTKTQGYMPPAYWGPIGEVRRRLGIPVVANGEIWTLDDFKRCRDETGAEHFMLGRGSLADPLLPRQVARELGLGDVSMEYDWRAAVARFAEVAGRYTDKPGYVACRIKQWARMSNQRFPKPWYDRLKTLGSVDEMLAVI